MRALRQWWNSLSAAGADYGYLTNSVKTILLVKDNLVDEAAMVFSGTGVTITAEGTRYLGSAIGKPEFREQFFLNKIEEWKREIEQLAVFAKTEPQAAFAALTHGLRGRYTYLLRTLPAPATGLRLFDQFLVAQLIPALTGRNNFSEEELTLLRLPARLGGLGIRHLDLIALEKILGSRAMAEGQVVEILLQNSEHVPSIDEVHKEAVRARHREKNRRRRQEAVRQRSLLQNSPSLRPSVELLSEKGSSSWLTVLQLKEHGFWLSKRDFRDALALRYNWQLEDTPWTCVCGTEFSADHAMTCSFGGFPTVRHNELRDIIAEQISEVCHVAVEPLLQPLDGETFKAKSTATSQEARSDVRAAGFWTRREDAFFDVRVFHSNAPSYRQMTFLEACEHHQRLKQLEYEERVINVDHDSFCPLVFSTSGAIGPLCTRFLKRLA